MIRIKAILAAILLAGALCSPAGHFAIADAEGAAASEGATTESTETESTELKSTETETVIYIASDLHYLSPRLGTTGAAYETIAQPRDGKTVLYTEALMDAFVDRIIADAPDAVILSGDLTFNGELYSHQDLAAKLARIDPSITRVYVIPGNHDINNVYASSFEGSGSSPAEYVTPAQFAEIYDAFGESLAGYAKSYTLDYMARPETGPWILMLDTNRYQDNVRQGYPDAGGRADESLFPWMERMLGRAREADRPVISVTHHNLFAHNRSLRTNYTMDNASALLEVLQRAGIQLHLSGHIHAQDILLNEGMYDVASGALSVYPHKFGVLRCAGERMEYRTERLDLQAWANARDLDDPNLVAYDRYARDYLDATLSNMAERIDAEKFTPEQREAMLAMIRELNARYFTGEELTAADIADQATYQLLLENGESLSDYIAFITREDGIDDNHLVIEE